MAPATFRIPTSLARSSDLAASEVDVIDPGNANDQEGDEEQKRN